MTIILAYRVLPSSMVQFAGLNTCRHWRNTPAYHACKTTSDSGASEAEAVWTRTEESVVEGTLGWLNDFVVGEGLCPWAMKSLPRMRLALVDGRPTDRDGHVQIVLTEAGKLLHLSRTNLQHCVVGSLMAAGAETTLLVFTNKEFDNLQGLPAFTQLWQDASRAISEEYSLNADVGHDEGNGIDLLAFHPCREDFGPGCRKSPLDAGHFSTRAPFPTLQLLRIADLEAARHEWSGRSGRSKANKGAFDLLIRNKLKLRAKGRRTLQAQFDEWRGQNSTCANQFRKELHVWKWDHLRPV